MLLVPYMWAGMTFLPIQKLMFRSWACTSSPLCFQPCSREYQLKTRTYKLASLELTTPKNNYRTCSITGTISVL